jgi:hypothetical protein
MLKLQKREQLTIKEQELKVFCPKTLISFLSKKPTFTQHDVRGDLDKTVTYSERNGKLKETN